MKSCDYQDSPERAAELLRLTLQAMGRHRVVTNPQNIAIWYEYLAGSSQALQVDMDALIAQGEKFDDVTNRELFNRHILQDRENLEQIREALGRLVAELQQQVRDTGGGIPRYVETLSRFAAVLSSGIEVQAADVDRVLFETRSTYDNQTRLQQELAGVYGEMESLRRELNHLREEAMMDALTGIGNRRAFDVAVAAVLQDRPTNGCLFSVLLVDIDDFKRFNDTYGHLIGDRVLRFVARVLKSSIKGRDTAARYGGEEFAVLLPGTAIENARSVAEQIRKEVAAGVLKDTNSGREFGRITISVGVGTYRNGETMDAVMDRADKALYRAKNSGKDRVVMAH